MAVISAGSVELGAMGFSCMGVRDLRCAGPRLQGGGSAGRSPGMDIDDLEPRKVKPKPRDLDALGIAELEDYLSQLLGEAERVRQKIAAKKAYLGGAAGLFKT